jgi:ABC-2 type transport system ATP-binding protein
MSDPTPREPAPEAAHPTHATGGLAVETRRLTRTFGELRAVDGIDLAVPAGSFFGFLGPNGAGKSTTIKCLTGLLRPSGGTMRILGRDPLADPVAVKRRIGVIPEDLALFDRLSGAENLTFVGRVYGLDGATVEERAEELLDLFDLGDAAGTLVADYSHGMRKKLSLAAALLPSPRLLFLDEPFEGIDAVASRLIKRLLHDFVARGGTIFLTSHVLEIVERLASHVAIIHRGRLVAQGPVEELRAASGEAGQTLEEIFLGVVGARDDEDRELAWL